MDLTVLQLKIRDLHPNYPKYRQWEECLIGNILDLQDAVGQLSALTNNSRYEHSIPFNKEEYIAALKQSIYSLCQLSNELNIDLSDISREIIWEKFSSTKEKNYG